MRRRGPAPRHLYEYEANLRDRLLAHRLDLYRRFAANLRRRYRVVYLEAMDLRRLAQDDPTREPATPDAQHWRHWAAVSELRACIDDAGLTVVKVEPAYSTLTCSWCGYLDQNWDPASAVEHTCSQCGRTWDQDANAARNLLAWGQERLRAAG